MQCSQPYSGGTVQAFHLISFYPSFSLRTKTAPVACISRKHLIRFTDKSQPGNSRPQRGSLFSKDLHSACPCYCPPDEHRRPDHSHIVLYIAMVVDFKQQGTVGETIVQWHQPEMTVQAGCVCCRISASLFSEGRIRRFVPFVHHSR